MKSLRHFCAITVLTFTLTLSAFAGTIECGTVPPPPSTQTATRNDLTTGITVIDEGSAETATIDPLTEFTLSILQTMLALF
jgi:hypothetical protein